MSTATQPPTTLDVSNTPRTPFTTLVRVELRKTYDTRAGVWLLGDHGVPRRRRSW